MRWKKPQNIALCGSPGSKSIAYECTPPRSSTDLHQRTGIVAPPSEQEHSYQVKTKAADAPYVGPEEWVKSAPLVEGSWWPEWTKWLTAQSGEPCEPPRMGVGCAEGESLPDAPGDYVRQ